MRFRDRSEAGRLLASRLKEFAGQPETLVLALPRGGVPVGFELANALGVPLDVFVVRKLGVPGQEELAMGAIASGGVRVLNYPAIAALAIPEAAIAAVEAVEARELYRREELYRGPRPPLEVGGRKVILTDDGVATGSTMRAAIAALRQRQPESIVLAIPVAAPATCRQLQEEADRVVCLSTPEAFSAVGQWYDDFGQVGDAQVRDWLERAGRMRAAS
jgi:predicted phosphoribosyltransferase